MLPLPIPSMFLPPQPQFQSIWLWRIQQEFYQMLSICRDQTAATVLRAQPLHQQWEQTHDQD